MSRRGHIFAGAAPGRPKQARGPLGGRSAVPGAGGAVLSGAAPGRPKQARGPLGGRSAVPGAGGAGFTLVEVLVALAIMAILAAMAFRGIDALAHARETALSSTDRTLKLNTGMSQFEYDISQVVDTKVLPSAIMFDGASLRVARRTSTGLQLVIWTLQDRRWQRWASPPVIHQSQLTEAWMRSQQWSAISGAAITVLEDVDDFQVYLCNPNSTTSTSGGCSWNNVQSTQGTKTEDTTTSVQAAGIRITLKLREGEIQRERELPRWGGLTS